MAEIVRLITHSQHAVVVEVAWNKDLPGHVYKVVLDVELEVDLLVVGLSLLAWLAEHKDLKRVFARLKVNPDHLARLVLVEAENFQIILVMVVILI